MNLKLTLMYDGTAYHGWQYQQNAITIQEVLQDAINAVIGKISSVTGCSRTDAGVHAKMYVCNFNTETSIPVDKIPLVLNGELPRDIRAVKCELVSDDFNARFNTVQKTYEYKILNTQHNNPFLRDYVWHYPINLDVDKMKEAASMIQGKRDFKAFMAAGSNVKSTVRNLKELTVEKNDDVISIKATADGFLYNMVRIIVGTLVYVGNGKIRVDQISDIIENKLRIDAGITAPPEGLALIDVVY